MEMGVGHFGDFINNFIKLCFTRKVFGGKLSNK